jgi:uncharacterized protein
MTIGTNVATLAPLMLAALAAGVIDAIAGGGGMISLPALLATGLPPHVALGTNKAQSIWGTSVALFTFWRRGLIDRKFVVVAFPLAIVGALAGTSLVLLISPQALRPVVMIVLPVAAALVWFRRKQQQPDQQRLPLLTLPVVAAATALAVYDGFLGPGTGTFLIVALSTLGTYSLQSASAHAKVVNVGSNLAALSLFAFHRDIRWDIALPMAAAQIVGGRVGALIALRGGSKLVRIAVIVVSLALMAKVGYQVFS